MKRCLALQIAVLSAPLFAIVISLAFIERAHGQSFRKANENALEAITQELRKLDPTAANAADLVSQGRQIFRFDTFGDEAFWGGQLRLHEAIEGAAHGGVGPGLSPKTALCL